MDTKEKFKDFVKKNPVLLKYVQNNRMTWQKFYEMYDMYGEDESAWKDFLKGKDESSFASTLGLFDFIKNLDVDNIQSSINSMQRVVSLLQEMTSKNSNQASNSMENYKPRPVYKHFED